MLLVFSLITIYIYTYIYAIVKILAVITTIACGNSCTWAHVADHL